MALRALGRVAVASDALEDAAAQFREALTIFSAIPARFEVARTRLLLAEVTHRLGDRDTALDDLSRAQEDFLALDTPIYRQRADELALKLGLRR